ncbi:hypothetical protein [Paenibacillus sp. FSL P2-0136]|uniref:alpha-amylase family glycosyl hydrolase n=1 Tax=Paenibacillus sp. FSL P2-0136 TaxID=2975317 RepID=UPI0030D7B3D0
MKRAFWKEAVVYLIYPRYTEINGEQALADADSVFYYYQELIRLRKQHPIMVYADYELLLQEHEYIYAYTRTLEGEKWLILESAGSGSLTNADKPLQV